jgi:hypothetical protein
VLLARLLPLTAGLLGVNRSCREIVIALLERVAAASGLERFRVYTWDDFLQQVIAACRVKRPSPVPAGFRLPRVLPGNGPWPPPLRELLLDLLIAALLAFTSLR